MTNAELIQKIRAEIKRRYNKHKYSTAITEMVYAEEDEQILSFLSTLESEKPISQNEDFEKEIVDYWTTMGWSMVMTLAKFKVIARYFYGLGLGVNDKSEKSVNPDDAMKELDEKIALVKQRGTWDRVDVDKYMDEVRGREPEKPMSPEEELKKEIEKKYDQAKWGYVDGFGAVVMDKGQFIRIARHFAQWGAERQKEQDDRLVDIIYQQGIEKGKDEIRKTLKRKEKK